MSVCVRVYTYVHVYVHVCVYVYVCVRVCIRGCVEVCMFCMSAVEVSTLVCVRTNFSVTMTVGVP